MTGEAIGVFGFLLLTFIEAQTEASFPNKTQFKSINSLSWDIQTFLNASREESLMEQHTVLDILDDMEMLIRQEEARAPKYFI